MVDLGGYVIILVETTDQKIKLYGSPADRADLEVGDEILEVNGRSLENCTHTEVISHIHQCIRSRTICLRVKRKTGSKLALDLASNSNVQDAFVIAVEQQARERLEKLSALKRIKPVDMTKLSQELNECPHTTDVDVINGVIESHSIYVTSVPEIQNATLERARKDRLSSGSIHLNSTDSLRRKTPSPASSPLGKLSAASSVNQGGPGEALNGDSTNGHCKTLSEDPEDLLIDEESGDPFDPVDDDFFDDQEPDQELELKQDILNPEELSPSVASTPQKTSVVRVLPISPVLPLDLIATTKTVNKFSVTPVVTDAVRKPIPALTLRAPTEVHENPEEEDEDSSVFIPEVQTMEVERGSNGHHREMAVDVPDTFVAVTKTPPRYPPPKQAISLTEALKQKQRNNNNNGVVISADPASGKGVLSSTIGLSDSSRSSTASGTSERGGITSDLKKPPVVSPAGRPQTNGKALVGKPANGVAMTTADVTAQPKVSKDEQIERIRKYQEDIRKRREEEDRIAKEEAFLRSSLRGSKKLQALESGIPTLPRSGVINTGFQLEEGDSATLPIGDRKGTSLLVADVVDHKGPELPELSRIVGAPELLQSLQRIETHLRSNNSHLPTKGTTEDLSGIKALFKNTDFQKLLAVHNKVQEIWCFQCPPNPTCDDVENLTQEVMNSLQECSLPDAIELVDILSKYEFEGLMYSHDKIAERQVVPAMTPDEELLDRASQYTQDSVKIVRIDKSNEPLGATVRNEGEAVVIGRIVKGGAAEKSGLLHEGDEILEVNNIEMRAKSVNDVCDILATMTGTLTFLIVPSQYDKPKSPPVENIMHIKAHFDYDPDDDLYIPCRELGISFQKGDILHVINQEDANWWQAYREGEEDQTLAGLIPSKTFQQQREAMKQTIVGDTNNKEKSKKGKFLCAKKHHKKKKKKALYNENANEEVDVDQILTYEEVSLYRPRANRKRPIVLIGPHNIGRQELRQRLMENTERFAAAVPHTSRIKRDSELDGEDYHFISRTQFESDIVSGRFVEHGEYEKSYYGTSLDAIRAVVNSGKICVLNLHPQSLKMLKNSDLKPYIVLVAPPSLEKLRQNRLKAGASAKDDELKDIIEKAREMEENYGHYFDMIVINSDVDKAFGELLQEINILEKEPQWVPNVWLKNEPPQN